MNAGVVGKEVQDVITGFQGIAIGYTRWLTGCNTVGIVPRVTDKDGKPQDAQWFDESRIKILNDGVIEHFPPSPSVLSGGPSPSVPRDGLGVPR